MDFIKSMAKTVGPRLAAVFAGFISTKIAEKYGAVVDPSALIAIGTGVYAGVHKAISAKVNPGDAATARVADAIKDAAGEAGPNEVIIPPKT